MGVKKPEKSKAPANVLDQSIFVGGTTDPCCIPAGVETQGVLGAIQGAGPSSMSTVDNGLGHIMNPTAH